MMASIILALLAAEMNIIISEGKYITALIVWSHRQICEDCHWSAAQTHCAVLICPDTIFDLHKPLGPEMVEKHAANL